MLVKEIIRHAIASELKSLAVGDVGTDDARTPVQQNNLDTILSYLYQGLVALSREFPITLRTDEVDVDVTDTDPITMPSDAAYIVKATRILDGSDIPINDPTYKFAFENDSYEGLYLDTIGVNLFYIGGKGVRGEVANITYSILPTSVKYTDNLTLPVAYLEALINYMAYKANLVVKAAPNTEQTDFYKKFLNNIVALKSITENTYEATLNNKLIRRGFA